MSNAPDDDIAFVCVRCGAEIVFGSFASSRAEDTQQSVAGMAAGLVGWRETFAGWQCPNHSPAGRAPARLAQGIEAFGEDASAASSRSDESPVVADDAPDLHGSSYPTSVGSE